MEVADDAKSCLGCGSSLLSMKECPQCHAQCSSDLAFCGECGCPLDISDLDMSEPSSTACDVGNFQNSIGSEANEAQKATKIGKAAERENECEPLIKIGTYEEHPPKWNSLTPRCWRGRMNRRDYSLFLGEFWLVFIASLLVFIASLRFFILLPLPLYLLFLRWGADVRRFHDIGWSGWWVLPFRVFEVVLVIMGLSWQEWLFFFFPLLLDTLVFEWFSGTNGPNKYGPDTAFGRQTGDVARTAQKVHILIELKKMRDPGLISESEYEERRSKVMERYQTTE